MNYLYKCLSCGTNKYSIDRIENFECRVCKNNLQALYEEINLNNLGPCKLCIFFNDNTCTYKLHVPHSIKNIEYDKIKMNPEDGIKCICFKLIVT
jgi:hypothetical protein